jgi:hypothetical protein
MALGLVTAMDCPSVGRGDTLYILSCVGGGECGRPPLRISVGEGTQPKTKKRGSGKMESMYIEI